MSNNMDKIKAAIESISNGLASIESSDDWIRYLKFCSKYVICLLSGY